MRVLMVHNLYLQPGGEDQSVAADVEMLREAGHEVRLVTFSNEGLAEHPLRGAQSTVWNRAAARTIQNAGRALRPDIVHLQNSFPLVGGAGYLAARRQGPLVVHLRNYRRSCLSADHFREGAPCH